MDNARYQRYTKDACLIRVFNLPAAGATVASPSLDLGNSEIGPGARHFDVEIAVNATPALADTKKVTFTLTDSDDNIAFAAVPYIAPLVVTGVGVNGAPATKLQFGLATSIRRYLQVSAAVDAGAGNSMAVTGSIALVF